MPTVWNRALSIVRTAGLKRQKNKVAKAKKSLGETDPALVKPPTTCRLENETRMSRRPFVT